MYNYHPLLIKNNSLVLLDCTEVKKKLCLLSVTRSLSLNGLNLKSIKQSTHLHSLAPPVAFLLVLHISCDAFFAAFTFSRA